MNLLEYANNLNLNAVYLGRPLFTLRNFFTVPPGGASCVSCPPGSFCNTTGIGAKTAIA